MLCIPTTDGHFKFLAGEELNNFVNINFSES